MRRSSVEAVIVGHERAASFPEKKTSWAGSLRRRRASLAYGCGPARGPPYWMSRVLRRAAGDDESAA